MSNTFKKAFGISSSDQGHILTILRDKVYSDKVAAVVREYSTNAQDANTAAKSTRPIEITLPIRPRTSSFKIRDFGAGLTRQEIEEIYVKYGKSTRRGDATTTGQLGLGCKAAFAYQDEFFVTSINGGTKSKYRAYIDPSNHGMIELISEAKTKSPSGVEIEVAVRYDDNSAFAENVKTLLRFFEPLPKLLNGPGNLFNDEYHLIGATTSGRMWKFPKGYTTYRETSIAIMGGVPYPIDRQHIRATNGVTRNQLDVLAYKCRIWFGPDELDFAASREHLEYTAKTVNNIAAAARDVYASIKKVVETSVESEPTLIEAFRRYHELYRLSDIVASSSVITPVWGGTTPIGRHILSHSHIIAAALSSNNDIKLYECSVNRGSSRTAVEQFRRSTVYQIPIWDKDSSRYVAEADVSSRWIIRAEKLHASLVTKEHPNPKLYIIKGPTPDITSKVVAHFNLESLPVKKLSDVDLSKVSRKKRTASPKYTKDAFVLDTTTADKYPASAYFKPAIIDLLHGTGIYFAIDRFQVKFGNFWMGPGQVKSKMDIIEECVGSRPPIYGIRIDTANKHVGPGWMTFEEALKKTVKTTLKDNPGLGTEVARRTLSSSVSHDLIEVVNEAQNILDNKSPFIVATKAIVDLDKESAESKKAREAHPILFNFLNSAIQYPTNRYNRYGQVDDDWVKDELDIPNTTNMDKKLGKIYPLLSQLDVFSGQSFLYSRVDGGVQNLDHILLYMKAVDATL